MTFKEQLDTITKIATVDQAAAFTNAWRFAVDQGGAGWFRSLTSTVTVYGYAAQLLRKSKLVLAHRQRTVTDAAFFVPVKPEQLICRAKRSDIERLLTLVKELYGSNAALYQRALFNPHYPSICAITQRDKDALAHMNVLSLVYIAELRS